MSNLAIRFGGRLPVLCAVCAPALGFGTTPQPHRGPVLWLCGNQACLKAGKKLHTMRADTLDNHEASAASEAGKIAAEFLEQIGKTDLALLTPDEWKEFLHRFVIAFEFAMRSRILGDEAPF